MVVNDSVGEHAGGEMGHALAEDREGTISIHGGERIASSSIGHDTAFRASD
jgi:hypothetical protein